jgi:hypothetical protein
LAGTVGAGRIGAAHGARDDHRLVAGHQQIEEEGRFLDRVGALDDDRPVDAVGEGGLEPLATSTRLVSVRDGLATRKGEAASISATSARAGTEATSSAAPSLSA